MTQLIIALDFPDTKSALQMVDKIGAQGAFYKVGLELFISEGYKIIPALKDRGKKIFLDLKIHDIPNTASGAITSCLKHGADIVNVHTQGGIEMMRACVNAVNEACARKNMPKPLLIGVTLLTSLDEEHLKLFDISGVSAGQYVLKLAGLAHKTGLDGIVCSAHETKSIKEKLGRDFITITPGIRFHDGKAADQKRVVTPHEAASAGTDYIVVGRPITASHDPRGVVAKILEF